MSQDSHCLGNRNLSVAATERETERQRGRVALPALSARPAPRQGRVLVHHAQGRACGSECGSPSRSLRWLTRPTCRRSRLSPRKTFGDFVAQGEWEQLEGPFLSLRRRSFAWAGPLRLLPSPPECVKTMSAQGRAELFGRQLRPSGRALRGRDFRTRVRLSRPGVSPT